MRNLTGKYSRRNPNKPNDPNLQGSQIPARSEFNDSGSLGEDLLVHSEAVPASSIFQRPPFLRVRFIAIILVLFGSASWFCFLGPGAPILEENLKKLAEQAAVTPAFTFPISQTPSNTPDTDIPTKPPSSTVKPSTPTVMLTKTSTTTPSATPSPSTEPSPTPVPIQSTPTPTSEVAGCVPASEVTLADVGKTLCVSGRVFRSIDKPASFLIIVVEQPDAFYFVSYDLKFEDLQKKQCIYATGEIRQLGFNPIMVVSYSVPLQYCANR